MLPAAVSRPTTNDKINRLINEAAEDDEDEATRRRHMSALKNRLRRGALYGCGARAIIPKIKVLLISF